jgi:hypothetical protein
MKTEAMTEIMITEALEGVQARISRAEEERAGLERTIAAAREEERLLQRLLALRRGATPAEDGRAIATAHEGEAGSAEQEGAVAASHHTKHPSVEAVVRELISAARPLHISDLMRLLREGGVQIPGAGTQANLITHLRREPRLVRPSRGMYGLAEWGLKNMPPAKRRKRRKSVHVP